MECRDINAAYSYFVDLITSIIDELAPAKEIRLKKDLQEWISYGLHKLESLKPCAEFNKKKEKIFYH